MRKGLIVPLACALLVGSFCMAPLLFPNRTRFLRTDIDASSVLSCVEALGQRRTSLPPFQLIGLRSGGAPSGTNAVVACYERNDIVCDEMRRHGEFEPNVVGWVTSSAENLRAMVSEALDELHRRSKRGTRSSHCVATPEDNDVVYIDIGGNVGVFAEEMLRRNFRSHIFEALPTNAALIDLGICVNSKLRAAAGMQPMLYTLTNKALGPQGSTATCVALSTSDNVGDASLVCKPDDVVAAKRVERRISESSLPRETVITSMSLEDQQLAKQLRGIVELQSLDSILSSWSPSTFRNAASSVCVGQDAVAQYIGAGQLVDDTVPSQKTFASTHVEEDQFKIRGHFVFRAAPFVVSPTTPTDELIRFVAHSQVVVKMDVETFEHNIVKGAESFLTTTATRPKVIIAEIWKHKDVTAFCTRMVRYGYTACSPDGGVRPLRWLRFPQDCKQFHEALTSEMASFVFVQPGFEHVVALDVQPAI